jgi:hypothetical protein
MSNAGASLGSMLAINSTLDSLNLNSTDLGPNGVEALLQPLTDHATAQPRNKSLTHLTIGGRSFKMRQGVGEAIAHMRRTNDTLPHIHPVYLYEPDGGGVSFEEAIRCLNQSQPEKLGFKFEREVDGYDEAYKEHRHQFIDAVSTCQSLKELSINAYDQKLSIEEVTLLCQNLLPALNSLTLDGLLDNDGVQIVCEKMENNCILKNLSLGLMEGRMSSASASLGSMLAINSTLDSLNLNSTHLGPNGVEAVLKPLTGHATDPPLNKSLTHLTIGGSCFKMRQGAGEAIAHMLRTNDTLTHFRCFPGDNGLEPSDVCKILESLQQNQTLLSLSLWGCPAVKGPDVSAKMRDLL